jgi:hypothetical protein
MKKVLVVLSDEAVKRVGDIKKEIEEIGGTGKELPGISGRLMVDIPPEYLARLKNIQGLKIERGSRYSP